MLHRITTLGEPRCSSPQNQLSTKERLLEAALRVFAERGFHGASIRDICRHAQANVATVHYYYPLCHWSFETHLKRRKV